MVALGCREATECVEFLLERGASTESSPKMSPVTEAIKYQTPELVDMMLELGVPLDTPQVGAILCAIQAPTAARAV